MSEAPLGCGRVNDTFSGRRQMIHDSKQTADAETSTVRARQHRVTGYAVRTSLLHAQAGSIECGCRLSSSFDNSEHKPIGSSKKKPTQSAPFMTSGGTGLENIIVNK